MRGKSALLMASLGLAGFAPVPLSAADLVDPNVQATQDDQVRELLAEGVKLYRVGRYDEAALRLKDALLLQPADRLVYDFYLAMGDRLLVRMGERAELEGVMKDVLRQARIYQKTLRYDPRYIDLLIEKLRASEKERIAATAELVAIGPVAMPQLVARLVDSRQDDFRVWTRMVIARMGYRAVLPLLPALDSSDLRQATSVATSLADIGDTRALPKLQRLIADDATDRVLKDACRAAVAAIAARNSLADIAESSFLYYQEALRYFRGGDDVRNESIANEALVWRWDDAAETKLAYTRVPGYAWNELVAEDLLFEAMASFPAFDAYYPLLAGVLGAQDVEVDLRLRLA
ncbi:MAG: HEAT repeat domain-containing protein, partial [Planctomycetota bacterium]